MKYLFLLLFPVAFLSTAGTFIPAKKTTVGYFYRDSLLHELPGYKIAFDSVKTYCSEMHHTIALYKTEMEGKEKELQSPDTAKLSPLIRQLKHRQIDEMRNNLSEMKGLLQIDSVVLLQNKTRPLYTRIDAAADSVKVKKNYSAVIDRENTMEYEKWQKEGAKFKNAHGDLQEALGISKK